MENINSPQTVDTENINSPQTAVMENINLQVAIPATEASNSVEFYRENLLATETTLPMRENRGIEVKDGGTFVNSAAVFGPAHFGTQVIQHVHVTTSAASTSSRKDNFTLDREELKSLYTTSEANMYPIPWREDIVFDPENHFVDLQLEVLDKNGKIKTERVINLNELFSPVARGTEAPRQILIRADPGFGKTTLCTKIAWDWANGKQTFPQFECQDTFLVVIRLRDLPEGSNVEQEILKFVHEYSNPEGDIEDTKKYLRSLGRKAMYVLDGFDEVTTVHQSQIKVNILDPKTRSESVIKSGTIILTSRLETDPTFLGLFDRQYLIGGCSDEQIERIVYLVLSIGYEVRGLIRLIRDNFESKRVSPLLVLLLSIFHSEDIGSNDVLKEDELCKEFCFYLARMYFQRKKIDMKDDIIRHKIEKMGDFYLESLTREKILHTSNELRDYFQEDYDLVVGCGILRKTTLRKGKSEEVFEPSHKILFDVLAMASLNSR